MNIKKITFFVFLLICMISFCSPEKAFASEATLSLSGGGTYKPGDSLTINVKYTGATFGSATAQLTYDSAVLEYTGTSGAEANGGGGTVMVSMVNGSGSSSLNCSVGFKAKAVGSSSVTVSTLDIYNIDLEEMSSGSKTTTVTVKNPVVEASGNANLSSIKVSSGRLSPSFSPSVTSYTVYVSNDVKECSLSVTKEHSKAKFDITGSNSLSVGDNIRKITVTAENGKTKTYTVNIHREKQQNNNNEGNNNTGNNNSENNGNNNNNNNSNKEEDKEEIKKEEEKQIETVVGNTLYIVEENYTGIKLPNGFKLSSAEYNDKEIPVAENKESKMMIAVLKKSQNEEGSWFFYNEEENQFTEELSLSVNDLDTYVQKSIISMDKAKEDEIEKLNKKITNAENDIQKRENIILYSFIGNGILFVSLISLLIYLIVKKPKKKVGRH